MPNQARRVKLEAALDQADGNITRSAAILGLSRVYATTLLVRFDLLEYARELRRQAWGRPSGRGRPPVG